MSGPTVEAATLARLCALNTRRAAEEDTGHIRWLRPEFQCREQGAGSMEKQPQSKGDRPPACQRKSGFQPDGGSGSDDRPEALHPSSGGTPDLRRAQRAKPAKHPWPQTLPDQAAAVRAALATHPTATDAATLARHFKAAKAGRVQEILETLVSLGQARAAEGGRFVGV